MSQGRAEDIPPPPTTRRNGDSTGGAERSLSGSSPRTRSDKSYSYSRSVSPRSDRSNKKVARRRNDRDDSRTPRSRNSRSSRSYSSYSRSSSSYSSRSYSSRSRSDSRDRRKSPRRARSPSGERRAARREVIDPSRIPMMPVPGTYGGYSHMPPPPPPQQMLHQPPYYTPHLPPPPPPRPAVPTDPQLDIVVKLAERENELTAERSSRHRRLGLNDLFPIGATKEANTGVNSAILHRVCVEFSAPLVFQSSATNNAAPASGQLSKKDILRGKGRAANLRNNAELKQAITEALRFVRHHIAAGHSEELAKGLIWRVVEAQGQQDRLGAWMLVDEIMSTVSDVADCAAGADPFALDGRPSDADARRSGIADGVISDQGHQSELMKSPQAQQTAAKFMHRMREYLPYLILFCWEGGPLSQAARHPRVTGFSPAVAAVVKNTHSAAKHSSTTSPSSSVVAEAEMNRIGRVVKDFLYGYINGDGTVTEAGSRKMRLDRAGGMSGPNATSGFKSMGAQGPITAATEGSEIKLSDSARFNIMKQLSEAYDNILSGWEQQFGPFFHTHIIKAVCDNLIVVCSGGSSGNGIITEAHRKKYQKYFVPPTNGFLDSIWKLRRKEPRPALAEFILVVYGWPYHRLASSSNPAEQFEREEQFGALMPAIPFVSHLPSSLDDLAKAGCSPMNSRALAWVRRIIEKKGGCTMCDTWEHTSMVCPNRAEVVYLRSGERLASRMSGSKARAELEKAGFVLESIADSPAIRHLVTQEDRDAASAQFAVSSASHAPVMEKRLRLLTAAVLDKACEYLVLGVDHASLLDALDVILGQRSSAAERHALVVVATYHLCPSRILRMMAVAPNNHRAALREFCTEAGLSTMSHLHRNNRFREADKLERAIETLFYRFCPSKYVPLSVRPSTDVASVFSDVIIVQKLRTFLFSWWERPLEECIVKGLDGEASQSSGSQRDNPSTTPSSLSVVFSETFDQLTALLRDSNEPNALVLVTALRRLRKVSGLISRVTLEVTPLGCHRPAASPFQTLPDRNRNVAGEIALYAGGSTVATDIALLRWDWLIAKDAVLANFGIRDGPAAGEERGPRQRPREQYEEFVQTINNKAYDVKEDGNELGFFKLTIAKALVEARDYCFFCHKIGHCKSRCQQMLTMLLSRNADWNIKTITEARLSYNRLRLRLAQLQTESIPTMQKSIEANDALKGDLGVDLGNKKAELEAAVEVRAELERKRSAEIEAGNEITQTLLNEIAKAASIVEQKQEDVHVVEGDIERSIHFGETLESDIKIRRRECNQLEDVLNVMSPEGFRFMPDSFGKKGQRVNVFAGTPNPVHGFPATYKESIDELSRVGLSLKNLRYCGTRCITMLRNADASSLMQQVQPIIEAGFPDVDFDTGRFLADVFARKEEVARREHRAGARPGILADSITDLGEREVEMHFNTSAPVESARLLYDIQQASKERMVEFAIYLKTIYGGMENVFSVLTPATPHSRMVFADLTSRGAPLWREALNRVNVQGAVDRYAVLQRLRTEASFFRAISTHEAKMAYVFYSLFQVRANLRSSVDQLAQKWEGMTIQASGSLTNGAASQSLLASQSMGSEAAYVFGPSHVPSKERSVAGLVSELGRKYDLEVSRRSMKRTTSSLRDPSLGTRLTSRAPSNGLGMSYSRASMFRDASTELFRNSSLSAYRPSVPLHATTTTTTESRDNGTQLMYTQDDSTFADPNNGNGYHLGLVDPMFTLGEKRPRQEEEAY